jgi:hypothetical protein
MADRRVGGTIRISATPSRDMADGGRVAGRENSDVDILAWLWWAVASVLSVAWSLSWFLLGGWVSTIAQIAVLVGIIFFYKYGWQRAPAEIAARVSTFGRFVWNWMRQRETGPAGASRTEVREVVRTVRVKETGDVNLSSLLNVLAFAGIVLLAIS